MTVKQVKAINDWVGQRYNPFMQVKQIHHLDLEFANRGLDRDGKAQVDSSQEMTDGRLNLKRKQKGGWSREPGMLETDPWNGKSLEPLEWREGRKLP